MSDFSNPLLTDVDIISQSSPSFLSSFELDTMRVFKPIIDLEGYDFDFLIDLIEGVETKYGITGFYKGFKIIIKDRGITLIGSFSNFFVGKYRLLEYRQLSAAVDRLSYELKLNLNSAYLYRVDININIPTDKSSNKYTGDLYTYLSRFKRLEQDDGVIFKTKSKAIAIYNKNREIFDKTGVIIGDVIRVEFRILKNVKKIAGISKVRDLYTIENYNSLLKSFKGCYDKIKKQRISNDDYFKYSTSKEYENHLLLKGVEAKGGDKAVFKEIEQLDVQGVFKCKKQKYRLRKKINNLLTLPRETIAHPLVKELDEKFEKFYRNELIIKNK